MSEPSDSRFAELLESIAQIAAGHLEQRVPVSAGHDELDAIAHAINVLVGELQIKNEGLQRAKEDAEAASVAKTAFLRNVSHEIRTPLSVILGMAEMMASGRLPAGRFEELHARIVSNGRALIAILDDLVDLARIEADKFDFELQSIAVEDIVADVLVSFEMEAARKSLRLLIEREEGTPKTIVDLKRLRQILTNVIGYAVKFTARGEVTVRIGRSEGDSQVVVDITDTGIGMTRSQSRLLFEPFVQADTTIARRFGGSGLGLALSRRFAEGLGGTLVVIDSAPGVGATFRLTLPAAETSPERSLDALSATARWDAELAGRRILVADDNDDLRMMLVEFLTSRGATVVEAADGREAIDRSRQMEFDVILMDVRMPILDGLKATQRLRAEGVTAPIVALTADAVTEQRAECFKAGCSAYLAKPIELARLLAHLKGELRS